MTKTYNASDIFSVEMGFSVKDLIGMEHSPFDGNQGLENTPPSTSAMGAQQHKATTITPEKLRELAHPGRPHPQGFHQVIAEYQNALRAAADEIERLQLDLDAADYALQFGPD
ncbi:MAG: hypothetical protein LCH78_18055 [Proteobacteria bacterium]|nr:hypothetical protein [Pseudomonadota bacterium]